MPKIALFTCPMRPFALGRRALLLANTSQRLEFSATCYSPIGTAKVNDLEPLSYIHHVLKRIAAADKVEKLELLLPWDSG